MNAIFHKQFEEEFLKSEKIRVSILAGIFILATSYAGFNFLSLREIVSPEVKYGLMTSLTFLACMALFELTMVGFVYRQIHKGFRRIPVWAQYLNAFMEISAPTVLMVVLASSLPNPAFVINSPVANMYFVFIILSTLRLEFKISLFIAFVAFAEFSILGLTMMSSSNMETMEQIQYSNMVMIARGFVILFAGLGGAFVARQIRKKIDRSLLGAEKENRIINLFGQQVSQEIVQEMLQSNGNIQSKLMRVCVMFIDIRNFTSYVTGKSPAEIVAYQNSFFSIVIEVITKHGGIVNQFLGDGCMVTFGAPIPLSNACQAAVQAAFEIREQLLLHAQNNLMHPTTVGIGIHVGEAVTGNIGTELRQQYSITGSVVILAARIEQLNKEYQSQILISSEIVKEAPDFTREAESIGDVILKGWNEPVGIYKLA